MRRFIFIGLLLVSFAFSDVCAQDRGVEFSFFPSTKDTTVGNLLQFELVAKDEDGVIIKDWDNTGYPIEIVLHNSTANTDTNSISWNGDKFGFSYAELYDAFGKTFPHSDPNTFLISNEKFGNGRLQVALAHTKANSDVYLDIQPKTSMSLRQNTSMYTFIPGSVSNFFVDITTSNASQDKVYLLREYEIVTAARDRYMNIIDAPVKVQWTARFPGEFKSGAGLPETISGLTGTLVTFTETRMKGNDHLQWVRVWKSDATQVRGQSDEYEIVEHAPGDFALETPPDGESVDLLSFQTPYEFIWAPSQDAYTNILVSRIDGTTASDVPQYKIVFEDANDATNRISFAADDDGRKPWFTTTHGGLSLIAKSLHGLDATGLDAYWYVETTDGIWTTTSDPIDGQPGNHITANLATIEVDPVYTVAHEFTLAQNYPNPFNPSTTITYSVPERTPVRILVSNIYGSHVATLVNTVAEPGYYSVVWNGLNDNGNPVPSGNYIYTMVAGNVVTSHTMSLIK